MAAASLCCVEPNRFELEERDAIGVRLEFSKGLHNSEDNFKEEPVTLGRRQLSDLQDRLGDLRAVQPLPLSQLEASDEPQELSSPRGASAVFSDLSTDVALASEALSPGRAAKGRDGQGAAAAPGPASAPGRRDGDDAAGLAQSVRRMKVSLSGSAAAKQDLVCPCVPLRLFLDPVIVFLVMVSGFGSVGLCAAGFADCERWTGALTGWAVAVGMLYLAMGSGHLPWQCAPFVYFTYWLFDTLLDLFLLSRTLCMPIVSLVLFLLLYRFFKRKRFYLATCSLVAVAMAVPVLYSLFGMRLLMLSGSSFAVALLAPVASAVVVVSMTSLPYLWGSSGLDFRGSPPHYIWTGLTMCCTSGDVLRLMSFMKVAESEDPWAVAGSLVLAMVSGVLCDFFGRDALLTRITCRLRGAPFWVDPLTDTYSRSRFTTSYILLYVAAVPASLIVWSGAPWANQPSFGIGFLAYLVTALCSDALVVLLHRRRFGCRGMSFWTTAVRLSTIPRELWQPTVAASPPSDVWAPTCLSERFPACSEERLAMLTVTAMSGSFFLSGIAGTYGGCYFWEPPC